MRGTRMVAAIATAVVAAALAAAVVAFGGSEPTPRHQTPVATTQATPSPTSSAPEPAIGIDDLPLGPAPSIAYVDDYEFVAADGSRSPLPRGYGVSGIAPCGEGFLVSDTRIFEGTVGLALIDGAGHRALEMGSTGSPVTSRDGRLVAWATYTSPETGQPENPVVHVAPVDDCAGGGTSQSIGFGAVVNGFLGEELVFSRMFAQGAWLTNLSGKPRRIPDLAAVNGIDPVGGWVAGLLLDHPEQSGVLDPRTGDHRWQVSGVDLGTFSPDASMIVGRSRRDILVFDARTGDRIASLLIPRGIKSFAIPVWEGVSHLLVTAFQGRKSAILRIGLDGTIETATVVTPGDVMAPPYTLATRP